MFFSIDKEIHMHRKIDGIVTFVNDKITSLQNDFIGNFIILLSMYNLKMRQQIAITIATKNVELAPNPICNKI